MRQLCKWLGFVIVFVIALNAVRLHPIPNYGTFHRSWTGILPEFFQFLEGPEAFYGSQIYPPHSYYTFTGDSGNLGLGGIGKGMLMTPPTNADEALVCQEFVQLWVNNSGNVSTADNATYLSGIGVSNPTAGTAGNNNGCPMFPYIGDHIYSPGPVSINGTLSIPAFSLAGKSASVMQERIDAIFYNGLYGCGGGDAISAASFSGGLVTITIGSTNTNTYQVGGYIQVVNSSVSGNNSAPGQAYQITALDAIHITYNDPNGAACSSSCGNVAYPFQEGNPPYQMLLGANGTDFPAAAATVVRTATGGPASVAYSALANMVCTPLLACPNFNGCGLWANSSGGQVNGPAYQ